MVIFVSDFLESGNFFLVALRLTNMSIITAIAALLSSIGVISALLTSAWQTHELVKQTKISNGIGALGAVYSYLERLQNIEKEFIEKPYLAKYFYESVDVVDDEVIRVQVEALSRGFADCLDYGLDINIMLPGVLKPAAFRDHSMNLRENSPAMRRLVTKHPEWWPTLAKLWLRDEAAAGSADS
ncbi:hypothetical protein [Streptosporangium sp. 'caverna']|uniref:hypothetical protein n=1 Tax=Streptosporangium sp. 'caverna' TaxID=2202249 RepID=UPI0013A68908|nr:hypothetical protein [Streptosporangium sp. 'caverna']